MQNQTEKSLHFIVSHTTGIDWQSLEHLFDKSHFNGPHSHKGQGKFDLQLPSTSEHFPVIAQHVLKYCDVPSLFRTDSSNHLKQWLLQSPVTRILLLYGNPETCLASAAGSKESPTAALEQWQRDVREYLHLKQQHPDRVSIFNIDVLLLQSDILAPTLEQATGWPIAIHDTSEMQEGCQATQEEPATGEMLAACMVQQSIDTQDLLAELAASSSNFSQPNTFSTVNFDALFENLTYGQQKHQEAFKQLEKERDNATQQQTHTEENNKTLQEENELILLQLHQVQEELERSFLKQQASEKQTALDSKKPQANVVAAPTSNESNHLKDENRSLKDENDLILLQLHQVQEELERYFLKLQKSEKRINMIHQSTSWRITAPLRSIVLAVRGKNNKKSQGKRV